METVVWYEFNKKFVFSDNIDIDPSIKYNRLKLKGELGIFEYYSYLFYFSAWTLL
tara:strand:+ start:2536 stop:2700 length:165 start_codon:yes stop_codon:yes gene_type:complete